MKRSNTGKKGPAVRGNPKSWGMLLAVILRPENRKLTVQETCDLAGIGINTYYRCFNNPDFRKLYREESERLAERSAAPIINACMLEAVNGSFPHSKLLLEMAGYHADRLDIKGNVKIIMSKELEELAD